MKLSCAKKKIAKILCRQCQGSRERAVLESKHRERRAFAQLTRWSYREGIVGKLLSDLGVAIRPPVAGFAAAKTVKRRESVKSKIRNGLKCTHIYTYISYFLRKHIKSKNHSKHREQRVFSFSIQQNNNSNSRFVHSRVNPRSIEDPILRSALFSPTKEENQG